MGNSMRGAQIALRQGSVVTPPGVDTTNSLLGKTEAEIRARYGPPVEVAGPRWQYETSDGVLVLQLVFENGRVVRVRPGTLKLTDVVPNR
jgi:hypothetical protein